MILKIKNREFNIVGLDCEYDEYGYPVDIVIHSNNKDDLDEIAEYAYYGYNIKENDGDVGPWHNTRVKYSALYARLDDFKIVGNLNTSTHYIDRKQMWDDIDNGLA